MIKKYYKNISPDSAKNRIAKLVNAHNAAWKSHREIQDIADKDSYIYKRSLDRAITYSHALRVMGIVEDEILENL
jgi:hypothetical protein